MAMYTFLNKEKVVRISDPQLAVTGDLLVLKTIGSKDNDQKITITVGSRSLTSSTVSFDIGEPFGKIIISKGGRKGWYDIQWDVAFQPDSGSKVISKTFEFDCLIRRDISKFVERGVYHIYDVGYVYRDGNGHYLILSNLNYASNAVFHDDSELPDEYDIDRMVSFPERPKVDDGKKSI